MVRFSIGEKMEFDDVNHVDPREQMIGVLSELNFDKITSDYDENIDELSVFLVHKSLTPHSLAINYHPKNNLHGLMDAETSRIICMSTWSSTIIALTEMLNTTPWFNLSHATQFPRMFLTSESWMYQYNTIDNKVAKTFEELSISRIYRFKLLQEKSAALDTIHAFISTYRLPHHKDLPLQAEIYLEKFRQAKEIYKKKLTEDNRHIYPFVTDYALIKNISLADAAQEIFFKFKSYVHKLSDTENIRIKYTTMIKDEYDIRKISSIMKDFDKECRLYGKI